jgi:hypothetical protein
MSHPLFQSQHLNDRTRREAFRLAREQLAAACGTVTRAGDQPEVFSGTDESVEVPQVFDPQPHCYYRLYDGERRHSLRPGINSIGRLPDNHVVLTDEHISRRHCAIIIHSDGSCEIHDIASKNGTIVNGKRIAGPTRLNSGDQITLCQRTLIFEIENLDTDTKFQTAVLPATCEDCRRGIRPSA